MRTLLIGATGFIGPPLIAELQRLGHDVTVLVRPTSHASLPAGVERIEGDRQHLVETAGRALQRVQPDVVIDLILSSGRQARELMAACADTTARVVAISSMDVYRAVGVLHGSEPGPLEPLPITEDSALRTSLQTYPPAQLDTLRKTFNWVDEEYDKIPVEQAVLGDHVMPGTVLRLPMVYGPGDRLHRFYGMLRRMDDRRPSIVMQDTWGAWRPPRGYVEDVAHAIVLAATTEGAAGRVYNVGEAESFSEREWAELIARAVGWNGEIIALPEDRLPEKLRIRANLAQNWVVDTTRIRRELGYREVVSREVAFERTIEWERMNPPPDASPGVPGSVIDYAAEDEALRRRIGSSE